MKADDVPGMIEIDPIILVYEVNKLQRLLAEACKHLDYDDGYGNELHECSEELQQWYEENKKQDEERNKSAG